MSSFCRPKNLPFVSIIIPTFNRKSRLRNCLNSLRKLDYPRSLLEIIVVENGSLDGTRRMVSNEFKEVKLVVEWRQGVSFARNTGVRHSKGEIMSFIDDDCQVDRGWLKKTVRNFYSKNIIGVGGPCILRLNAVQADDKLFALFSRFGHFDLGHHRQYVIHLSGANMSFKQEAFKFASFDPELGPPKGYLEDFDFCETLHRLGFRLLYDPKAIVYHSPVLSKLSFYYILVNRGPKECFSLYYYNRKRKPWIEVLTMFVRNCLTGISIFLVRRNGISFWNLIKSFYCIWACLLKFSTPVRKSHADNSKNESHTQKPTD